MRRALLLSVLLVGCSAPASPSAPGGTAPPAVEAPAPAPDVALAVCPEGEPFVERSGKIVVEVAVNGRTYDFILDTGAPYSVVDSSLRAELGDGPFAIDFASVKRTLTTVVFADLRSARTPGAGILGADVFGSMSLTVDYPRSRVILQPKRDEAALVACAHVEGQPGEADLTKRQYMYVPGKAEGVDGWFLVDTGASLGAMPDSSFDALNEARPRNALEGFYTPAAVGTFFARLASIGSYEVGGKRVGRVVVRTMPDDLVAAPTSAFGGKPFWGVLPSGFMRNFMVTVDYPRKKLRLDAKKGASLEDSNRYFTVGIGLEPHVALPVTVGNVVPKSAAAEAGIVVGDVITRLDNVDVKDIDPYARSFRLVGVPPTKTVAVTIERGNQTFLLDTRDLLLAP